MSDPVFLLAKWFFIYVILFFVSISIAYYSLHLPPFSFFVLHGGAAWHRMIICGVACMRAGGEVESIRNEAAIYEMMFHPTGNTSVCILYIQSDISPEGVFVSIRLLLVMNKFST